MPRRISLPVRVTSIPSQPFLSSNTARPHSSSRVLSSTILNFRRDRSLQYHGQVEVKMTIGLNVGVH